MSIPERNPSRFEEPRWAELTDVQVRQAYTTTGLALYNYIRWGLKELVDESRNLGNEELTESIASLRTVFTQNYYAARAHWRRGDHRIAARLLWRTAVSATEGDERIRQLANGLPRWLELINRVGLRPYLNQLHQAMESIAKGAETIATAAGAGFGVVVLVGGLVLLAALK